MQQTSDKMFEKSVQCTFTDIWILNCKKTHALTHIIFLLEITETFIQTSPSVNTFFCYAFFSLNE